MSIVSFWDVMRETEAGEIEPCVDTYGFTVSPGCKTMNRGYFTILRVDRDTLPEGWYAYDIRHGDSGGLYSVEEFVLVNHAGTFLTQKPMKMNSRGFHCLRGGGGYSFYY